MGCYFFLSRGEPTIALPPPLEACHVVWVSIIVCLNLLGLGNLHLSCEPTLTSVSLRDGMVLDVSFGLIFFQVFVCLGGMSVQGMCMWCPTLDLWTSGKFSCWQIYTTDALALAPLVRGTVFFSLFTCLLSGDVMPWLYSFNLSKWSDFQLFQTFRNKACLPWVFFL